MNTKSYEAIPSGVVGCYSIKEKGGPIVAQSVRPDFACLLLDALNADKPKPLKFELDEKLEELKSGQWWLWSCYADMSDGTNRRGTVQGADELVGVVEPSTWQEEDV
jgi:hypothetical protein